MSNSCKPGSMVLSENSTMWPKNRFEFRKWYCHRAYLLPWILVILVPSMLRLVLVYDITFPLQLLPNALLFNRPEELELYRQPKDGSPEDEHTSIIKGSPVAQPNEELMRKTHDNWMSADAKALLKIKPSHKHTGKDWSTRLDKNLENKENNTKIDAVSSGMVEGKGKDLIKGIGNEGQLLEPRGQKGFQQWSQQNHDRGQMPLLKDEFGHSPEEQEKGHDQHHFELVQSDKQRKGADEEGAEDSQEIQVLEEKKGEEEKKDIEETEVEAAQEKEGDEKRRAGDQGGEGEKKGKEEISSITLIEQQSGEEKSFNGDKEQDTVVKEEPTEVSNDTEGRKQENKEEQSMDSSSESQEDSTILDDQTNLKGTSLPRGECDVFDGDWEYDPEGPLYTNSTCFLIPFYHNCISNGRLDTDFLYWRWKPHGCDLPRFEAKPFMEAFRGKTIGFVGDSLARNQMESMRCLLAMEEEPIFMHDDLSSSWWLYEQHQVTVVSIWSPYLLKWSGEGIMGYEKGQVVLYLDVLDPYWTSTLQDLDLVVFSVGQWYFKPAVYIMQDEVIGCHRCPHLNMTQINFFDAYSEGLRQTLEKVVVDYKGIAILSTYGTPHGEHRRVNEVEQCRRERPLEREEFERTFKGKHEEMRNIVWGEFNRVVNGGEKNVPHNLHMDFLDVSKVTFFRADGHPGPFLKANPYEGKNPDDLLHNDCLHWCLPGPIDTWNQLLVNIVHKYL